VIRTRRRLARSEAPAAEPEVAYGGVLALQRSAGARTDRPIDPAGDRRDLDPRQRHARRAAAAATALEEDKIVDR